MVCDSFVFLHIQSCINPGAVWLVCPNGPVSVCPEGTSCSGCSPITNRGATLRCLTSKCSVGSQTPAGKDVTALVVAPKPSGIQIGRKTLDAASRTKQSEVASDATSDDEYTGPGLKFNYRLTFF